jgi:hypothetical protein
MIPTDQPSGSSQILRIDLPSTLMPLPLTQQCLVKGRKSQSSQSLS